MSSPSQMPSINPLHLVGAAGIGASLGLLVQAWLSSRGRGPAVPPYSMAITLVAVAVVLIALGIRLRRQMAKGTGAVNPFQAVRLLVTARAGQIVGSAFAGLGGGLLLSLAGRSVPAPTATWLPMLVTVGAAITLLVCAFITERMCRVPPGDDEAGEEGAGLTTLET